MAIKIDKIRRNHEFKIANSPDSIMVFGRRKVGKTFFVRNFLDFDKYFFVGKNNVVFDENNDTLNYDSFFTVFKALAAEKVLVIDEFHRLPEYFLDYLHFKKPKKVILLTSTLWLASKLLETKDSPLTGIVTPVRFSIINEIDILNELSSYNLKETELFEAAIYLREPILLSKYKGNIRKTVSQFLYTNKYYLLGLIGEIFSEEQRQFSRIYEGILFAISLGKVGSGEISSYLFSKKLIKKDSPGLIQRYLLVLIHLGLIEKLSVFGKKRFYYHITSPLLDLFFYLNSKYDYLEQELPLNFIETVVNEKLPIHIEMFFSKLFSKLYGLKVVKIDKPEIDIALLRFNKLEFIAEVKWRNSFDNKNDKIFSKLSDFSCNKKFIVSKAPINSKIKQFSLKEILALVKKNG